MCSHRTARAKLNFVSTLREEPLIFLVSQNYCVIAQQFEGGVVKVFGGLSRIGRFRGTAGRGGDEVQELEQHRVS